MHSPQANANSGEPMLWQVGRRSDGRALWCCLWLEGSVEGCKEVGGRPAVRARKRKVRSPRARIQLMVDRRTGDR